MLPEMKLIYQVFCLLSTHIVLSTRVSFELDFVTSCENKIDIDLRRKALEDSMKERDQTSANNIWDSVNDVYGESIDNAGIDPTAADGDDEGELDPNRGSDVVTEQEMNATNDARKSSKAKTQRIRKKELHVHISKNVEAMGITKLASTDIIHKRAELARVRSIKSNLRQAIMHSISGMKRREKDVRVGSENGTTAGPWERQTRNRTNVLGLKTSYETN